MELQHRCPTLFILGKQSRSLKVEQMEKDPCIDGWSDKDEQRLTLWLLALENQSELIVFAITTFDFQLNLSIFCGKSSLFENQNKSE